MPTEHDDTTVQMGTHTHVANVDFELPLHAENQPAQLCRATDWNTTPIITAIQHLLLSHDAPPSCSLTTSPQEERVPTRWINRIGASSMEKDILNYETWHQRLGHCSEKRLRKTQQLVHGIPTFRTATLPHVVNCRTCDVAKLTKASRGPPTVQPATLQLGQIFSIDIGFIPGPANLAAVLARTEEPQPKVIESRQGYTCYLLIVDTKSRYIWVFPLKLKSVPLTLVKTFLQVHGNHTCTNRRIRTDGEGSLAESQPCRTLLTTLGYLLEKSATDSSSQNGMVERPHQTLAAMVWFFLYSSSLPVTFWANGMVERPHQTLAAMVRCFLYSSSLPVTFWADALVYAVYVNNRLYSTGLGGIPYTAWTGNIPNLRHLRVFGAHTSVRRGGNRPTKTDLHYYNGRFLRFSASEQNIVYFDTVTKRDKYAKHCVLDEFHYSTPRLARPLGAQQLLDRVLPHHVPPSTAVRS